MRMFPRTVRLGLLRRATRSVHKGRSAQVVAVKGEDQHLGHSAMAVIETFTLGKLECFKQARALMTLVSS